MFLIYKNKFIRSAFGFQGEFEGFTPHSNLRYDLIEPKLRCLGQGPQDAEGGSGGRWGAVAPRQELRSRGC